MARRLGLHANDAGRTLVMTAVVLGILAILALEVWAGAAAYDALGMTRAFPMPRGFSAALFSTIGYGGMAFDHSWRLLTALDGTIGFLMIGWSTAYLVRVSTLPCFLRQDRSAA